MPSGVGAGENMAYCRACGCPLSDAAHFCRACGAPHKKQPERPSEPNTAVKTASGVTENTAASLEEKKVVTPQSAHHAGSDDHVPTFAEWTTDTGASNRKLKKVLLGLSAAVIGILVVLAGITYFTKVNRPSPDPKAL